MDAIRRALILSVAAAALTLLGCGDSPTAPSGSGGVAVRGVLLGEGAAFTASSAGSTAANGGAITVVVEGTSITTTISGNGTFELEGLTPGTFTLVFLRDGTEIGRITVTAGDGFEVKIVVKLEDSVVVLVDLELDDHDDSNDDGNDENGGDKSCMIEGGRVGSRIELEGRVVSVNGGSFTMTTEGHRASGPVTVSASGASFKCNGNKGDSQCQATVGAKVHVRGTLTECSTTAASVTAAEVKMQKSDDGESDDGESDDDEDDD